MSCNACQSKFTFFTRENACPNCGFSYCGKCLKYKHHLGKGDGGGKKICGPCHNKLKMTAESSSVDSSELPREAGEPSLVSVDATKKSSIRTDPCFRLDRSNNPVEPPIAIYAPSCRRDELETDLDPADKAIVDRLKKLKDGEARGVAPSTEEIVRRLAILKDDDPDRSRRPDDIYGRDARTDREKEDDLVREQLENFQLDSRCDPVKEIEARLNKLKGFETAKGSARSVDDDVDEASAARNIVERALAEAALEAKYEAEELEDSEKMDIRRDTAASSDDEVSCCMCEQTSGLVRCTGCIGDLYCEVCFEDNHDDCERTKHKATPYRGPTRNPSPDQ